MLRENLKEILIRDLNKLRSEIEMYTDESKLWVISGNIKNSDGNLCLHLTGNLQHFIGTVLGESGYVRNRDSEFSSKNIPKTKLLKSIDETIEVIEKTLSSLSEEVFSKIYPFEFANKKVTTRYFLLHLVAHLNYHLGQINYHRRLIK